MGMNIQDILGGTILDGVAKVVSLFKVPPEVALQHQSELAKIAADAAAKATESVNVEMQSAADIIKAEANSQSFIARNVRPALLFIWGLTITVAAVAPIIARIWIPSYPSVQLDPWIYKLTAIGFTGYVTARTWEKVTDSDK